MRSTDASLLLTLLPFNEWRWSRPRPRRSFPGTSARDPRPHRRSGSPAGLRARADAFSFFMGQALGPMVDGLTLPFIGATASCVFGAAVLAATGVTAEQAAQATPARWGLTGVCTAASDEVRSLPNHGSIWAAFGVSFVDEGGGLSSGLAQLGRRSQDPAASIGPAQQHLGAANDPAKEARRQVHVVEPRSWPGDHRRTRGLQGENVPDQAQEWGQGRHRAP